MRALWNQLVGIFTFIILPVALIGGGIWLVRKNADHGRTKAKTNKQAYQATPSGYANSKIVGNLKLYLETPGYTVTLRDTMKNGGQEKLSNIRMNITYMSGATTGSCPGTIRASTRSASSSSSGAAS